MFFNNKTFYLYVNDILYRKIQCFNALRVNSTIYKIFFHYKFMYFELTLRQIIEKTSIENGRPLAEGMLEKMFETTKLEKEKDINKNSLGLLDLFRF